MATLDEIAEALETLLLAFSAGQRGEKPDLIKLYAQHLEEIPGYVLRDGVKHLISTRTSPWFPSVAEIKEAAKHIMPGNWFETEPEKRPDDYNMVLDQEYLDLVVLYCSTPRQFDETRWTKLVGELKSVKRGERAKAVELRLDAFKWTVENEHTPMYAEEDEKQRQAYAMGNIPEGQIEMWRDKEAEEKREELSKERARSYPEDY